MTSENYIRLCMEQAQKAKGNTAPNPMVGAVLVHEGRIIGEGYHHFYGADHAEVNCLKNVAEVDKPLIPESTMYVNLEPCAHYGITPPCALRLVAEKVKKVVIANTDPFEQVSGKGISILREAGTTVETGILADEGLWVNRRFFCFHSLQRPYIILKWAQTKDRFIAPADKIRFQITGAESQALVHKWRTEEGAIMVGTTTALNDNPQLTARLHTGKQPLRIVLDRNLQIPHTHHLFDDTAATWIINEQMEALEGNVHLVQMTFDDTLLPQLLHRLYEHRILSIIIEGGAVLLNNFISQGLWDEARVFTSNATLNNGIAAPRLPHEFDEFYKEVGEDGLQLYVNKSSAYQYVPGPSAEL
ncbi:MAG: Riboflavin biosynthesis protein RibD [Flavipsychrobacter sp.]|nr:Riboflavin biosynthesis protein RibD [Flavipsychrobacter sp.]